MDSSIRFPVLLTVAERDTLHGTYNRTVFQGGFPRDLYQGNYVQGATVAEDCLESKLVKVSCSRHHEDYALAATQSGYIYCAKDRYLIHHSGQKPTPLPVVPEGQVRLSQDGKTLLDQWQPDAKLDRRVLRVTDLVSGVSRSLYDNPHVTVASFDLLGEDKAIVAVCPLRDLGNLGKKLGTEFVELDLKTGEFTTVRKEPSLDVMEMCLSPDHTRIALTDYKKWEVKLLDLSTGKRSNISNSKFEVDKEEEDDLDSLYDVPWRHNLHFSPDGSRVLYSRDNTVLKGNDFTAYSSLYAGSVAGGGVAKVAGDRWEDFYIHDACPLNNKSASS